MRTGQESAGVRGREPLVPIHADHGQGELFRSYLRSRTAFWAFFAGVAASFLYGAWKRDPLIMAAGPAAVALGVTGIAWFMADRAAARGGQSPAGRALDVRDAARGPAGRRGALRVGADRARVGRGEEGTRAQPIHPLRGGPRAVDGALQGGVPAAATRIHRLALGLAEGRAHTQRRG